MHSSCAHLSAHQSSLPTHFSPLLFPPPPPRLVKGRLRQHCHRCDWLAHRLLHFRHYLIKLCHRLPQPQAQPRPHHFRVHSAPLAHQAGQHFKENSNSMRLNQNSWNMTGHEYYLCLLAPEFFLSILQHQCPNWLMVPFFVLRCLVWSALWSWNPLKFRLRFSRFL